MSVLQAGATSVVVASPSPLDLTAVHTVVPLAPSIARSSGFRDVLASIVGGPTAAAVRARGHLIDIAVRHDDLVLSCIAPDASVLGTCAALAEMIDTDAHATTAAGASSAHGDAAQLDRRIDATLVDAGGARIVVPVDHTSDEAAAALLGAGRSIVVVAPEAALPTATQLAPFVRRSVRATSQAVGFDTDGAIISTTGGRRHTAVVTALLGSIDARRGPFVHGLLSAALCGHHDAVLTRSVDVALGGGYTVEASLRFVDGNELLRIAVSASSADRTAAALDTVLAVLERVPDLLDSAAEELRARAHVRSGFAVSRASLVSMAEGLTSCVLSGMPVDAYLASDSMIGETPWDDVIGASTRLSPDLCAIGMEAPPTYPATHTSTI